MLKKILATIIIVSFTQVYANYVTAERKELESHMAQAFDQLNYRLNVEWNQVDNAYFNEAMNDFEAQIADLQSKGLSNEQLVEFTTANIKDKASLEEVKKLSNVISQNNLSAAEARAFAVSKLNATYSKGASWSGGKGMIKVALLVAAVIIITKTLTKKNNDSTPTPTTTPEPTNSPEPTYSPTPTYSPSPSPSPTYTPCMPAFTANPYPCGLE